MFNKRKISSSNTQPNLLKKQLKKRIHEKEGYDDYETTTTTYYVIPHYYY